MRKKIKQVLCMFSALVVMICCAVPAFADDINQGGITQDTGIIHAVSYMKQQIIAKGGTLDNKNYIAFWSYPNDYAINVQLISFPNNTLNLTNGKYSFVHYAPDIYCDMSKYDYSKWDDYDRYTISISSSTSTIYDGTQEFFIDDSSSKSSWHIIDTNMKITNNGEDVTPTYPNTVPTPFTITYSPDLKLNLKRKTSDYETKSIDVTLTLNQDYLDWYIRRYAEMLGDKEVGTYDSASIKMILDSILNTLDVAKDFDLTGCGKSKCIYFISLSDPSKPLRTVTQNSVYTYLSQQRYSIIDRDNGDIDGSTSTAVYANGLYPYFTVDFNEYFKHSMQSDIASENCSYKKYQAVVKNLPSYQLSIPLENIDAEKFEVISVLNSILTCETLFPTESGQSVFDDSFKSAYSVDRGPKGVSFNNIDYVDVDKWDTDDTGYLDYFSKSDCYSVYTAKFSFDSYPKYVPLKDGKGNDIDMIKTNPFDYSMHPVKPGTYQSVNKDGTLSEERTLEEQKKHDKDNTFSKNFASVDYTDFSSIFSTSSSYFEFLTASIRILPDWFIATFTAWFVTFLTLALIKYVIQ